MLKMDTNGSHRSEQWWLELSTTLNAGDEITFSIDGVPATNHQYRVNSKWNLLETGIRTVRKACPGVNMRWKHIIFRYNEYHIHSAMELAFDLGFNQFMPIQSSRDNGPLNATRSSDEIYEEMRTWLDSFQNAKLAL
jgi:sulfatase maturation enzyme AslB (radical SAM superfamily)